MTSPEFTQEQIDDQMLDDDCPNCGGAGFVDSCFEDTCVCIDPPCHMARCGWCNHDGMRVKEPPAHGDDRPEREAGPLLKIMENDQ